ncbi:AEC family transporter [Sutterella sp.]|uniref:AEC family transporter n=1 Tax=Sutterella sp. TaxID=1981025 RepID=UPI0026E0C166|nr:AEC family transporter [Sutterella sp.]MDO5531595.1 AEC family transporter [Sutterella sp.]
MEESFAKVLSFVVFIALGWGLRRFGILKPEAFHAISGLVMCVTLPCVTMTGLNGLDMGADMVMMALIGFAANVVFLVFWIVATLRTQDPELRDFRRLNGSGFSIGPFAIPYVSTFLGSGGLLTALIFDVGNAVMSAGGTYACIAGLRERTSPARMVKVVISKLFHSGPILAFVFMVVLCVLGLKLPDTIITCTKVGAAANTFLCMIMIGESINLSLTMREFVEIMKILLTRLVLQIGLALLMFYFLPFDMEVRRALVLCAFAPVPAMNLIYTNELKGNLSRAANLSSLSVAMAIISMSVAVNLM